MDFGFGLVAQKKVAELSVHKDWKQLSRVLSTIFLFLYPQRRRHYWRHAAEFASVDRHDQMVTMPIVNTFRQVLVLFLMFCWASRFRSGFPSKFFTASSESHWPTTWLPRASLVNFVLVLSRPSTIIGDRKNIRHLLTHLPRSQHPGGIPGIRSYAGSEAPAQIFFLEGVARDSMVFRLLHISASSPQSS